MHNFSNKFVFALNLLQQVRILNAASSFNDTHFSTTQTIVEWFISSDYSQSILYFRSNPSAKEVMIAELPLCEEMVVLLPRKIQKMQQERMS